MQTRTFAKLLRRNMTEAERKLWLHLRSSRLKGYKFKRQQPVGPYIVDFICYQARLVVEVDGGQHAGSVKDLQRDTWFTDNNFLVLRFWNNDVIFRTDNVLEKILMTIAKTPSPQPSPARGEGVDR